ncbi:MAG: fibronectin type III domain-containing protein [Deferribacteres bacterium]|nr:fibronectin type III domain-containing protein [candidate division KSB1 bacterium]MCB9502794.1 fibronectin type III domain-containing protein [Deferribacteres bacterium]
MFTIQRYVFTNLRILILAVTLIPANLFASSVVISWDANSESDLSGYEIRYGLSNTNMQNIVNTGKSTQHEFTNLNPGVTYYFVVFAIDYAGNKSDPSAVVSATLPNKEGSDGTTHTDIHNKIFGQNLWLPAFSYGAKIGGLGSIRDSLYYFWENGSISWQIEFDSTATYYFGFLAKTNALINNEWSTFEVQLDDNQLDIISVDSLAFKFFVRQYEIDAGKHVLRISFLNDLFNPGAGQDRNLIFDYVQISEFAIEKIRPGNNEGDKTPIAETTIDKVFELAQNYPNPFNPSTTISFNLEIKSYIQLSIFNIVGQKVKTVYAGELTAGDHNFKWNARDDFGQHLASGVYYYLLEALSVENFEGALALKTAQRETRPMTYIR